AVVASPTRPGHELPDSSDWIRRAARRLRREPLVVVVVTHHYDIGVVVVERLPQRLRLGRAPVTPGAEARMVPIGQDAGLRGGRQIGAQPQLLGGPGAHVDVRV